MSIFEMIAQQHPESAAVVFKKYGEADVAVNADTIHAMGVKYGAQFILDLNAQLETCYTTLPNGQLIKIKN